MIDIEAMVDELFESDCEHDDHENGVCINCGAQVDWKNFKESE